MLPGIILNLKLPGRGLRPDASMATPKEEDCDVEVIAPGLKGFGAKN